MQKKKAKLAMLSLAKLGVVCKCIINLCSVGLFFFFSVFV